MPVVETPVLVGNGWLLGGTFLNRSAADREIILTNTAGDEIFFVTIPANSPAQPFEWPFKPVEGLQWRASGAGVSGQLWGYPE